MKQIAKISGVIFILSIALWACKKETSDTILESKSEENLKNFLNDIYNKEIKVVNNQMLQEISKLESDYRTFESDPSEQNKESIQKQWKQTALIVGKCRLFNIATIDRRLYFKNLHSFPVSQSFVSGLEANYKNVTSSVDASTFPSSHKGLGMLEYLFYEEDSLESYHQLVYGLISDLKSVNGELVSKWTEIEENFISGNEITINNGYGELVNSFVSMIELSKKNSFDLPFGLGGTGNYKFEAEYSQYSHALFSSNFAYLNYLLTTYYQPLLKKENKESLYLDLNNVLGKLDQNLNQLTETSGQETFETVNPTTKESQLKLIQDDLNDVLKLVKIELSTLYDTLITFSPADGD